MKRLILDLDDVICGGGFLNVINMYAKTNYREKDITTYYLQDLIEKDKLDDFYDFLLTCNLYENINIFPNAIDVIEKLNNKYELYICSSFAVPNLKQGLGIMIKNKYDWLERNIPFITANQIILMSSKNLLDADIRIDDRMSNLDGTGSIKLLFTSWHNLNITNEELESKNIIRVNNWLDIANILLTNEEID
jgi:5'(3')-deoxyribonucleotidase